MNSFTEAVPWIVAALGWGATHLFSEARERRKEVRAQIDKALERLTAIEQSARAFHLSDEFDQQKALAILSDIGRLERFVGRITKFQIDNFTPVIIQHRRAITYKNLDKSSFNSQKFESELLADINSATQDFEDELEAQYRLSYPTTFPYFRMPSLLSRK